MGAAASARTIAATTTKKRKIVPATPPPSPKQSKQEEEEKKPINYRPIYEKASLKEKEIYNCLTNTAKYCFSPDKPERQAMLLAGFNMSEDQMYGWLVFSYSVKYNYAQPTSGFSPQEWDTEPGLNYVVKQKQVWMDFDKKDGFVVCSEI